MSRLERIMDMINVLSLEDGRLNFQYINKKYGITNRVFRRDIEFIRERLTYDNILAPCCEIEYVRSEHRYVVMGDKEHMVQAFVNATISDALSRSTPNRLKALLEGKEEEDSFYPIKYLYSAFEKVDYNIFSLLVLAIKNKNKIILDYRNSIGGESHNILCPLSLINYSQLWYLITKRNEGEDIRTFNLSRIISAKIMDETFTFDDYETLDKKISSGYGIFTLDDEAPVWYTIRFIGKAAHIVSNQIWHKEQRGEWIDDNTYELTLPSQSDIELLSRVKGYAPDAYPVSPVEFKEAFRSDITRTNSLIEEGKI